jgi:imidazolonepropionase-like amidohydrolase
MSPTPRRHSPVTVDEIKGGERRGEPRHKFVASHAHGPTGIMNASSRVKSIEHGSIQTKRRSKAMVEHKAIQVPTHRRQLQHSPEGHRRGHTRLGGQQG